MQLTCKVIGTITKTWEMPSKKKVNFSKSKQICLFFLINICPKGVLLY